MLIQIIVTIGILLFVLPSIYSSYKKKSITPFGTIVWVLFWIIGLILIWFPHLIDLIGSTLGVGRSIDAFVYIAIIFLLYSTLSQKIKINELSREITLMNRTLALKKIEKESK
ncbi:MAG: hypothetical protein UR34_C0020G0011 [candidate division WS6 bacterium GW2011_GWC1_33_20]|uniref:DUF2304 domain-containing protein n=1 Tax=candidate division WS6 bacterium GW2011_GWC1_33_20 TaxID=1619089 RepID=A0A0G0CHW7_9BACT|nr:MAG: hypothetical protein UR34_C0020G0011 [candidate division WS6 bacterium GW2011_GWC1_33_20]KKP44958.1 MAG: hypothetical protein UR36_C0012G0003 [candidate division WS6 bacterium GW2011_GWF1_33_233]KKP54470.1 MAG: hypothetical protein UR45_C0014G0003 [candidate division WS6 bacterium GW2011_WS6_33_547]OGC36550.1 MAG: hypothetical protein A2369_03565 [candidate division WS6 bacterium RIFOXYB1_FULL_33_15]